MIEFKKGTPDAIDCKVYPMSQKEDEALRDFLTEQLKKGYICPSKSQYASSSSLSQRRTENYAQSRIIDASMTAQYEINTHFPSSRTLSQTYRVVTFILNWTSTGDITMSASRRATNTKPPSKHATASMNRLSCSLAPLTPQLPSRR